MSEQSHHAGCPALYYVAMPHRCRCALLSLLDAAIFGAPTTETEETP